MSEDRITAVHFGGEEVETFIIVPPDGGWAWVVLVAGFFCNLIADGILYTFGMFLEVLSEEFDVTVGNVTMIGSIMCLFYYLVGPLVSALINRFGFRIVTCLGGLIGASAFIIGSYCYNFYAFAFIVGVVAGSGLGIVYVATTIVMGLYFEKWRSLASGIATCGSGIGTMVLPPIITLFSDRMDWRDTFQILAGFVVLTSLAALTYRPLIPVRVVHVQMKPISVPKQSQISSRLTLNEETLNCCRCRCSCRRLHNILYPTTSEVVPVEQATFETLDLELVDETPMESELNVRRYSRALSTVSGISTLSFFREGKCKRCCRVLCYSFRHSAARPMYRDDIFFQHDLRLLAEYRKSVSAPNKSKQKGKPQTSQGAKVKDARGYHMSVTRVTTAREVYGMENRCCNSCKCNLSVTRTLSTMLDCRLLRSPSFLLFAFNGFFIILGYMVPFLYIKDRAVKSGIPPTTAYWFLSVIGGSNTVGRIICGVLPALVTMNVIVYSYIWIFIAGVTTAVSGFFMEEWSQFLYAGLYGFSGSCITTLRPIIVVELFGLANLSNVFGLQLVFMAIGSFIGPSVAGFVYDATGDYNASFYLAGGFLVFSASLFICVKRVRMWEKKKGFVREF